MFAVETVLRVIELAGDKKGVRRLHGAQGNWSWPLKVNVWRTDNIWLGERKEKVKNILRHKVRAIYNQAFVPRGRSCLTFQQWWLVSPKEWCSAQGPSVCWYRRSKHTASCLPSSKERHGFHLPCGGLSPPTSLTKISNSLSTEVTHTVLSSQPLGPCTFQPSLGSTQPSFV